MDETPSNAVLMVKLESVSDIVVANQLQVKDFQANNKEEHQAILIQTSKTNGRVTTLEKWKNITIGALLFMNVLVVPIALALIMKYINSKP